MFSTSGCHLVNVELFCLLAHVLKVDQQSKSGHDKTERNRKKQKESEKEGGGIEPTTCNHQYDRTAPDGVF